MKRARHSEEQIIAVLQEAQAGSTIEELCRRHGISAATYYKWKQKFGGLEVRDAQREHHKHLKSTNMLERLNQELKRRTHVIRIFPNEESCLRLIRALAVEIHEDWIEAHRYLNMEMLREQRKQLQLLEAA